MSDHIHAHDLIWLDSASVIEGMNAEPGNCQWHTQLPVVVRRDTDATGRIPVGIRGHRRDQRWAGWVRREHIVRIQTPESLTTPAHLRHSPFCWHPAIRAALDLLLMDWTWNWGITGSAAYALATGEPVLHAASDLDIRIHCPKRPDTKELLRWHGMQTRFPCRIDTQVEVSRGAFSLEEWLKGAPVLLKTDKGPRLVADPWKQENGS
ncbi:malonate decarboxylase holo-ACP synthase [Oxalobacter sp. OttesenSCG-928-P03]|nr:malonate decarboxylase holo-ACP synthase [Oxalobacter sp. OttesenSCG-928-P03]